MKDQNELAISILEDTKIVHINSDDNIVFHDKGSGITFLLSRVRLLEFVTMMGESPIVLLTGIALRTINNKE